MKLLKENWFKAIIIFMVVLIVTGLFYWYEWRPSEIRKNCNGQVLNKIHDTYKNHPNTMEGFVLEQKTIDDDYESLYKQCLRENGL